VSSSGEIFDNFEGEDISGSLTHNMRIAGKGAAKAKKLTMNGH
jgi:hypothetical protein